MPTNNRPRWIRGQGWVSDGGATALRAPAATPVGAPVSVSPQAGSGGIYGSSYSDYYGPGLNAMQTALGSGGSNPARPLVRAGQTGLGSRVLSQIAFGNELEPQRQAIGRYALSLMTPGREEAMIAAEAARNRALAATAGRDADLQGRALGYGAGTNEGQYQNLLNEGNSATRGYARYLYSPEYRTQQAQNILQLISALSADDLDRLTQGSGMIQSSNLMRQPSQGQQLLGAVGNLAGLAAGSGWNPLARSGSGNLMNLSQAALGGG